MEVSKLGKITIDEPFLKYYSLKQKYESRKRQICPICSKGPLEFDIKERTLLSTCVNPLCTANMNIQIPSFYTYDQLLTEAQENYEQSQQEIVRRKFDLLFKYTQDTNIQAVRDSYLKHKSKHDAVQVGYHKMKMVHDQELGELYSQRKIFLDALKNPSADLKSIQTDLNAVLNRIHTLEYHVVGRAHVPYSPFINVVPVL
jgi:ribosomal 50S subunit-associated protein YjgA (DUF615 family)